MKASICPANAHTEVPIDSRKMGMRSRSMGISGAAWNHCRRRYTAATSSPPASSARPLAARLPSAP